MSVIERFKKIYWEGLQEYAQWEMHFFSLFPGKIGQAIRARYMRKKLGACGENLIMAHKVKIANPEKLYLGNHVGIGIGAYFTAGGKITVGDYVGIGPDTKIWSVNHVYKDPYLPWKLQGSETKEVKIGNDVWIGASSIIKPGVTIGDGAIIAAGTTLSKSIPAFAIVAGNPGRVVGWRHRTDKDQ